MLGRASGSDIAGVVFTKLRAGTLMA